PGRLEAIAKLNHAGYRVVGASNQSGLGRGRFDLGARNALNAQMVRRLARMGGRIDALFYCPHAAETKCDCRKPKPGMLIDIGQRFNVDLNGVPAVGDSLRDLQAASAVGAQPILVLTGKGKKTRSAGGMPDNTLVFADLAEAVRHIVA
ncbi:MAG: D-glycero-beta-D-manno-heptose 1,7-bisphosphate 7-phosphatase, partial [Burkholderiales bacterium]